MTYEIETKFMDNVKVKTIYGVRGIVKYTSHNISRGVNEYYIETGEDKTSKWYDESFLVPDED